MMLTSIRENPTEGDPLWIDNIYFMDDASSEKNATLYAGGGLMMTNVTMQGRSSLADSQMPNGAVIAADYAFHAQGLCAARHVA